MSRVVVVGASGHAKVVVDTLEQAGEYEVVGYVDADKPAGTSWYGLPVLGSDADLAAVCRAHRIEGGIVGVGDNAARGRIAERIAGDLPGFRFVDAVHPSARLARGVELGAGVLVVAGAIVGPDCAVGDHAVIYTGASLDHDSALGRCASLAPRAVTGGGVHIGDVTAVSIGAIVLHGRTIGAHTVVGAASLVVDDLPDHVVAYGAPARVIRPRAEGEPYL